MQTKEYHDRIIEYYQATENAYKDSWNLDNSLSIHYGYWDEKSEIVSSIVVADERGYDRSGREYDPGSPVGCRLWGRREQYISGLADRLQGDGNNH
jgi:hypothetical protein